METMMSETEFETIYTRLRQCAVDGVLLIGIVGLLAVQLPLGK
jgi:hypothetical protein